MVIRYAFPRGSVGTSNQQADSTPFILFMLSVIAQTLAQNAPVNAPANAPVNARMHAGLNVNANVDIRGLKTPDAIIALLTANPAFTRQQLADTVGKDLRTVGRAIAKLQQAGKITRTGSDKTGHWEIQP